MEIYLNLEDLFWQEKSKVKWHNGGDRNAAYFHMIAKIRNCTKLISSIQHKEEILTDCKVISNIFLTHFENLFNTRNASFENGLVEEVIPKLVTKQSNALLSSLPSFVEVQNVVFSLNKDGSPGHDGFEGHFFIIIGRSSKKM